MGKRYASSTSKMTAQGKFAQAPDDRAVEMMGSYLSYVAVARSRLSTITVVLAACRCRSTSFCVAYFAAESVTEAMIQSQVNEGDKTILLLHVRMYKRPYYELAVERTTSTEPEEIYGSTGLFIPCNRRRGP